MSIDALYNGFKLIEQNDHDDAFFKGEISESLILKAENFLGIQFPQSYRVFLSTKGCGDFRGREFYGIVDGDFENSSVPDAIWLTWRKHMDIHLDKCLLLIAQSIEGYYALDTSKMKDGECQVVDWIPNIPTEQLEIIAPDFGTFFLNEIKEALE